MSQTVDLPRPGGLNRDTVTKYKQLFTKWTPEQTLLNRHRQPVDALAKINNIAAQIHRWQVIR
jgi:hypothetical protein